MKKGPYDLHISSKTLFLNFFRRIFILTGTDKWLAHITRRKNIRSFASKLVPPNYLYPRGTYRYCNVEGVNYRVDLSETNGHINYFGLPDPGEQILFSNIRQGMTVIDIGANIGAISLQFAKRVTSSGKVFSFEPGPFNYSQAAKNLSLNPFTHVTLINQGLGDQKTTAALYNVNPNNRGMQRLLPEDTQHHSYPREEVEIDTLDDTMQKFSIPPPDFIKIDVEGFEMKVLLGGQQTIKASRPVLFIELDDRNLREQKSSAKELIRLLQDWDYRIINARTRVKIEVTADLTDCHFDVLCTHSIARLPIPES